MSIGRSGASSSGTRLGGLFTASFCARLALYAALLLAGFLAGSLLYGSDAAGGGGGGRLLALTPGGSSSAGRNGGAKRPNAADAAKRAKSQRNAFARALERGLGARPNVTGDDGSDGYEYGGGADTANPAAGATVVATANLPPADRTLRFQVCNGFANQRLAIMYGVLIGRRLGRAVVLPDLVANGLQRSDEAVVAMAGNEMPFADVYDQPYFVHRMAAAGVRALPPDDAPPPSLYTSFVRLGELGAWSVVRPLEAAPYGGVRHLAVDCPLFKWAPAELGAGEEVLMWAVLDALRPTAKAAAIVGEMAAAVTAAAAAVRAAAAKPPLPVAAGGGGREVKLVGGGGGAKPPGGDGGGGFNFIHLRIENDWVEHCRRWESIRDGIVRDNCYRHTDAIDDRIKLFGFSIAVPLYVACYWDDVDAERKEKVLGRLSAAGYTLVTSESLRPHLSLTGVTAAAAGGREFGGMLEYFLGLRADRLIGNSVSTFAALGMLERRHRGQWAAYYNGGNVPLGQVAPPLSRLPWVFTYNSWSASYDYMLKAAVRSGISTRSLQPYCLFMGDAASPIAAWLAAHNVTLIRHEPAWRQRLIDKARKHAKANVAHSHLFRSPDALVGTFQRVDLPVVPLLDQYTYVLFTDGDVFFRRPVHLDDFGLPLPVSIAMSYEFVNVFPYNAGVMLANLPTMRQRYGAFIRAMLDNDEGLYYTNYGPADQGIMNKFYEADLKAHLLDQAFNAKPYNPYDPNAFIAHFHGPKPHEFVTFLDSGKCDFYDICSNAFLNGLCPYAREWAQWAAEEVSAARLEDACGWLDSPHVSEVFRRKWGLAPAPAQAVPSEHQAAFVHADAVLRPETSDEQQQQQQQQQQQGGQAAAGQEARQQQQQLAAPPPPPESLQRMQRALLLERQRVRAAARAAERSAQHGGGGASGGSGSTRPPPGDLAAGAGGGQGEGGGAAAEGAAAVAAAAARANLTLQAFDTATVVAVDEAAVDAAWGTGQEGGRQ